MLFFNSGGAALKDLAPSVGSIIPAEEFRKKSAIRPKTARGKFTMDTD